MTHTFNSSEALKKLHAAKIYRANSTLYYILRNALDTFEVRGGVKIYHYQVTTGKWGKTVDYKPQIIAALNLLNLSYVEGNDAPRGGKTGNFIMI